MQHTELSWNTFDDIKIFGQTWQPDSGDIKAVICLAHGMGEHSGRYEHVARMLTDHGYAVLTFDFRGHGKSLGNRGHVPSYDALLNDIEQLLGKAEELFPGKKKFLYGHSMGGGVIANFILKRKSNIEGAILSSPYFKLAFAPPALKIKVGKIFEDIFPKLALPTGLDENHISRDKKEVDKYKKDPLVHDKISAKMGMAVIDNGQWALDNASKLNIPVLIFQGDADQLTSHDASKEFAEKAGKIATFHSFKGLYHETHNEPEREDVFKLVLDWLSAHL